MKASLTVLLVISFCAVLTLQAQQLRTEYPEIRLSDKRVLLDAQVEGFDGESFCISHESGIEPAAKWELMPDVWKKAFPYDPQRKAQLREIARTNEAKNRQPPPGSLKPTVEQREKAEEQKEAHGQAAKEEARQNVFNLAVQRGVPVPGMTAEQCVKALGEPTTKNFTAGDSGMSEQWVYPGGLYLYLENSVLSRVQGEVHPTSEPTSTPRYKPQ